MTNRFLRAMDRRGERSVATLKRLYRAACKHVHPDTGQQYGRAGASETFIALRLDYEEALIILEYGVDYQAERTGSVPPSGSPVAARSQTRAPNPSRLSRPSISTDLIAFRDACTRLGALAGHARCDPYEWNPAPEFMIELLRKADEALTRLDGQTVDGASALSTVFSALSGDAVRLRRYPGLMTRAYMLYKALYHWHEFSSRGSATDLDACRTKLEELADPTVALVHSEAVAEVVAAFPTAAATLMAALGINPRH